MKTSCIARQRRFVLPENQLANRFYCLLFKGKYCNLLAVKTSSPFETRHCLLVFLSIIYNSNREKKSQLLFVWPFRFPLKPRRAPATRKLLLTGFVPSIQ